MKKTLYLLTLAILASTFSHMAHAENLTISNKLNSSALIVISENGKVKSNKCLLPKQHIVLPEFEASHAYQVITLPIEGSCGQTTVQSSDFTMPKHGMRVRISNDAFILAEK